MASAHQLVDVIGKWSHQDLLNERLLFDADEPEATIPPTFLSLHHYFGSFRRPFLEETRAHMASRGSAPDAPRFDVRVERRVIRLAGFEPGGSVCFRRSSIGGGGGGGHVPEVADVVLLSAAGEPDGPGELGFVTEVSGGGCFRMKLGDLSGIKNGIAEDVSYVAVFLGNVGFRSEVWRCLNAVDGDDGGSNLDLVRQTLHPDSLVSVKDCSCFTESEILLNGTLRHSFHTCRLNESQMKAIIHVLCTLRCSHLLSIGRIYGYPGTGKTEIIAVVSCIVLQMKSKAVICAPTAYSVSDIVRRVLRLLDQSDFGTYNHGFTGPQSDIVVLGSQDSIIVSFEDRVRMLMPCFSSASGWKKRIDQMVDFLDGALQKYNISSNCEEYLKIPDISNLKEKFSSVAFSLKDCISLILNYLSSSLFSEAEVHDLASLVSLIQSMWSDLSNNCTNVAVEKFLISRRTCLDLLDALSNTLRIPVIADRQLIEHLCLQHASLIFCTVSDVSKLPSLGSISSASTVIVDRACELSESDSHVVLQLKGLRHVILFGGSCYKPPYVFSKNLQNTGYGRSLFERLCLSSDPECTLEIQYRMHPEISNFPSRKFFKKKLLDSPTILDRIIRERFLPDCISGAYRFIDVLDGREVDDEEAEVVFKIISTLSKDSGTLRDTLTVGVISPSASQICYIQAMLADRTDHEGGSRLWMKSFDDIECREVDVIIISTTGITRMAPSGLSQISGFCLTRARRFLWIVGNSEMLKRSCSVWQELVLDAEQRGCLCVATEDQFLANTILKIKSELQELDELLNPGTNHFTGTKWKVLVSNDFRRSFVGIKSNLTKKIILGLLWKLSCGWRPKRRSLYLSMYVKQFRVQGLTVVCTTDVVKENNYIQVMKVWDVLTLMDVPKLLQRLEHMMSLFDPIYVKYCMADKFEGTLLVPMSWTNCPESFLDKELLLHNSGSGNNINSFEDVIVRAESIKGLIMPRFYSLSSGYVKHLLTASNGEEIDLPFEVSDCESEIITFPESAFILGRSGTGKTYVLLTKLVQREQHYVLATQEYSETGLQFPINSHYFQEYDKMEAQSSNAIHQIFLTVNPNLCSAVKDSIARLRRYASGETGPEKWNVSYVSSAVESFTLFSEIPNSFTNISHSHFPLVVSLNKFLMMLDGTTKDSFFDTFSDIKDITGGKRRIARSHVLEQLIASKEVTYDCFLSSYWPHFNVELTRNLDPSLVFSQIIYCIKGQFSNDEKASHRVMRKDYYLELSNKRGSLVTKVKREMIYKIYRNYEEKKNINGQYDISDLVNHLLEQFSRYGYDGQNIDFMYIDEVQDFTMKQIGLFKYLCANFQSGFLFAGDTAQTLCNDFRFEDIKCWFYNECQSRSGNVNSFQLTTNFRSHSGIIDLAESVLDVLYHFFPDSVDKLDSEKTGLLGDMPVILQSGDLLDSIFNTIEFGSEQVILVRDVHNREKVLHQIGHRALVLTVKECKGLEFEDVLLYNFFEGSPSRNQWRILYEFMDHQKKATSSSCLSYPRFDIDKHNIFCSELKQLYVAITRTKNRLWIAESNEDFASPIFDYWKALGVVGVTKSDSSVVEKILVRCKPEDWNTRGKKFLNGGNYEMAILCFKRSGDVHMENCAHAALLQAEGSRKLLIDFKTAKCSLLNAADIYENIGEMELAASCFMKAKEYRKAGMIYLDNFHQPRFEDAGDCFCLAQCWSEAAKLYAQGICLSKCLSACIKGLHFVAGFSFLEQWPQPVSSSDRVDYIKSTVRAYCKLDGIDALWKFVKAFPDDAVDSLLASEDYDGALASARLRGEVLLEADILQKSRRYEESSRVMIFCAVEKMLWEDGNNGWPLKLSVQARDIVAEAKSIASLASSTVCSEADLLTNHTAHDVLSMHMKNGRSTQNLWENFLAARCVLDICLRAEVFDFYQGADITFDDRYKSRNALATLSAGSVSVQVLQFAWNLWNRTVQGILSYIQSFGTQDVKHTKYGELCMRYFGVRKLELKGVYVCANSRASWIRRWEHEHEHEQGLCAVENFAYINDTLFNSLAKKHWSSEIVSVGELVVKKLEELDLFFSSRRRCVIQRGLTAHRFYEVVLDFLKHVARFQSFLFTTFFPLDCCMGASLEQLSPSPVDVVLGKNLGSVCGRFEPTKFARILVFLLTRKPAGRVYERARELLGRDGSWQRLFDEATKFRPGVSRNATTPLVENFLALGNLDLQSQLLLLEHVLFSASLCGTGRGWFVTSRSSLSTFVSSKESVSYSEALAVSGIECLKHLPSCSPVYDLLLATARELLFVSHVRRATGGRIGEVVRFFRALLKRVVVLVGLVCLNSPQHLPKAKELLEEADGVLVGLPEKFLANFWNAREVRRWSLVQFGAALSRSMEAVDDWLVVVQFDGSSKPLRHLKPQYINYSVISRKARNLRS
ncbi:uncharacterized protein M6B38_145180 [Iris pallida]|uniref:UvrD-like helicase ATP-binding domain-containing protein n=1 Tax=Iris pallida TaxID=29817 RepID=A0AAX6F9A8_IRIPA|nr:uncharacterized protein M6B38_145180 [Iris pallida]